jgi:poly-gamma-glutamate capsule biosynthesis protein CapA/YwtB (metallophosphatase superfamily)
LDADVYRTVRSTSQKVGAGLKLAPTLLVLLLFSCGTRTTATLALLGDLVLGRGVNPQPDSLAYLAPDLSSADLALANLESPLASDLPSSDSPYNLCSPSIRADLLSAWSLDLLSLANNHNLDCGPAGPARTRSTLETAGITPIGPDMEPVTREVNGLQLAFLAFDDVSSPLDENAALKAIRSAHATGALVVVSIHWGAEYQGGASLRQETLAQEFAGSGAALVWGHHPHVLQPAAWIGTPPCDGSNPSQACTLVLYSLGNALFDQGGLDDTRQSALVLVTLDAHGVQAVRAKPFEINVVSSSLVQPDEVTADKILERLNIPGKDWFCRIFSGP